MTLDLQHRSHQLEDLVFVDDTVSYEKSGTPAERWGLSPSLGIPDYTLKRVERAGADSRVTTVLSGLNEPGAVAAAHGFGDVAREARTADGHDERCRPEIYRSDKSQIFPLAEQDSDALRAKYPRGAAFGE